MALADGRLSAPTASGRGDVQVRGLQRLPLNDLVSDDRIG